MQVPSGTNYQEDMRRRFGNICIRPGNRVRDLQPRSDSEVSEKMVQIHKNPELFSPVALVGLNNLLPLTGMKYFGLQAFRLREQQTRGKVVFSSMMCSSY